MESERIASVEILPNLPDYFHPERGDALPDGLLGATILSLGTLPLAQAVEGGGLVIDFQTRDGERKRVVLAFNETGMWISYEGPLGNPAPPPPER